VGQNREPSQNSPDSVLFSDVIRASSTMFPFYNKGFKLFFLIIIYPKLSSPQRDNLPASIKFPKYFQPVGTSKNSLPVSFATLKFAKIKVS